ncbi:TonB-dependent receptor [Acidipila sp. EB88]|uniref:TonB-dependent receptor n=1 Tax=Acidipila sp. EB88 TaxID=2305226 RepID=UPI000F5D6E22|nr:TonB-dependent receptor [Acidipila sp. EB88]RRA48167.1 TonB-dependent receptor [Acidipila sp. EB88]
MLGKFHRFSGPFVLVAALLAAALPARSLLAQAATGEFSITLADPSGAIVPGAEVTITGADTGAVVRVLRSSDHGIADVPLLQPGRYNVHVVAPGFKAFDRNAITVSVGSVISLDLKLDPGAVSETVTVTGDAPLVEDKSDTISQLISNKQLTDIPLNGRNYLDAANYIPGTVPTAAGRDNSFTAYGNTGLQNAFLLDGARNVNYLRGLDNLQRDMVRPPLDALREFTVDTSNFSAQYGAAAGGIVNAITRSGTNQFHGSAYDFVRNDHADAQNYFATTKPLLVRNQYGGSLGGPILRDRVWFFAAYEGVHQRDETTGTATVPTALERIGDFAQSPSAAKVTPIYNPATTVGTGTAATRAQFAGNIIPTAQINSIGAALAQLYPLPNDPALGPNIYRRNAPDRISVENGIARGDYQMSAKDAFFVRYAHQVTTTANEAILPAPASNPGQSVVNSQGIGVGYTRILSNTLIDEFRFAWTTTGIDSGGTAARDEVITGSLDPAVTTGTPLFNVSAYTGLGGQAPCCGNSPLNKTSGVFDFADNLSWSEGQHQLRFGGEVLLIRPSTFATSNGRSTFGYTGVFTQNPGARGSSGNAVADLLLGDTDTLTTGTVAQNQEREYGYGFYATDQWQLTNALTVNYGLRYEYNAPSIETQNRMGNFILDPGSPLYGQLIFSGDARLPRSLIVPDRNNIAPRIGLAYRVPNVKDMTIRSAYGIFYAQDEGTGVTNRLTSNPPFFGYGAVTTSSDQLNPATGFVLSPDATIARPAAIASSSFVLNPTATSTLVSWPTHFKTSYVQQWSLSVQKQLPWDVLFEINYVGNHGSQLLGLGQGNQPTVLNSTTVNSRRPLAQYTIAPVKTVGNWNSSQYEGISAKLEKRYAKGYSFLNSFTYGHAFDLQNPALDLCDTCGVGDTIQNNYDRAANYASSDNDVRFRYVLTGILELPFGNGKPFLNHASVLSTIAGGWAVSPVYQYQTGLPFTVGMSYDAANAGTLTRPTQVCNGNLQGAGTTSEWFNTACYVNTASYTFGNASRNGLRAPGINQLNLSAQRNFHVPRLRDSRLNMRLEGFNVLNHPLFSAPGATVGSALYGVISSAAAPRQVQVAARLTF